MLHEGNRGISFMLVALIAVLVIAIPSVTQVKASPNSYDFEPETIYSCFTDHRLLPPGGGDVVRYRIEYPYSELVSVRVIYASHDDYYWGWRWDHHYLRIVIINYSEALPLYIKWRICVIYH